MAPTPCIEQDVAVSYCNICAILGVSHTEWDKILWHNMIDVREVRSPEVKNPRKPPQTSQRVRRSISAFVNLLIIKLLQLRRSSQHLLRTFAGN
jgi:hypothetical protein